MEKTQPLKDEEPGEKSSVPGSRLWTSMVKILDSRRNNTTSVSDI